MTKESALFKRSTSGRFVVTGPSGWIGRSMLDQLEREFGADLQNRVIAFASNARTMKLPSGRTLRVRALEDLTAHDLADAHLIHLAYLTKELAEKLGERVFTDTNLAIDDLVLQAMADGRPASVFVASSGAAALAESGADRSAYGIAKLRQEARFLERGEQLGVQTLVGRIYNIAGANINKTASYAISNFIIQALTTARIEIAAGIPVFRSYLHVDDLCALVIASARVGLGSKTPVDLCGAEIVEMADLAAMVVRAIGSDVECVRGRVDWTRSNTYLGSFPETRVLAMRLQIDLASLDQQISDTMAWLGSTPELKVCSN